MGFQVLLDGQPAAGDHGTDADVQGRGTVTEPRLYQLIRQHRPVTERTIQVTFTDPGVHACYSPSARPRPRRG